MDKARIKAQLDKVFGNFQEALQQHDHINTKRADGGWSVGEIADHVLKSTGPDFATLTKETSREYDRYAANIRETFLHFDVKFEADPFLHPDHKTYTLSKLMERLEKNKTGLKKLVDENDLTRTCTTVELPGWGHLTVYEWLVLIENHMIRHTKQVNDFNR